MFGQAFERFPCQIEAVECEVLLFEARYNAKALSVVVEATVFAHDIIEGSLAGVTVGRVSKVMGQRQAFGQVFVEAQLAGDGARNLRHLQTVRQPRAIMVAFVVNKNLRLVSQTAEGCGMQDAVAIALKRTAGWTIGFCKLTPARRDGGSFIGRRGAHTGSQTGAIIGQAGAFRALLSGS